MFASDYPLPRFTNVAKEAGVDVYGISGGAVLDDFDNDGRLDLVISHIGFEDQTRFFWNRGDGTFEDRTEQAGLEGETGGLNMIQADYDNDGFVDLLILRGGWMGSEGRFPLSLLRNNGNGTFTDVTVAAGLLRFAPTQTAVWFDYDGDGWLDLFVGNESDPDFGPTNAHPCELFHNNGDGTFTNVAHEAGVDVVGFVKGVVSADYNSDGRPDLYLSLQGADNLLLPQRRPDRGTRLALHERRRGSPRHRAQAQLRGLLLRLRQRRLARPLRRGLRPQRTVGRGRRGRRLPGTCRPHGSGLASTTTGATGPSRT